MTTQFFCESARQLENGREEVPIIMRPPNPGDIPMKSERPP
jgi:hypothetical protein